MKTEDNLKPCPFCGGTAELLHGLVAFNDYEVQCKVCGASAGNFGAMDDDPDAKVWAISAWNTRVED